MIANLHIQTALRNDKTILKKAYYTTPFKIADITEDRREKKLKLMLMSSSPGILDEDEYNIKIEVAKDSSLELQTQSYQRIFSMKKGASQKMEVVMEEGCSFCHLPHPTVPHAAASFAVKNKIFLSSGCNLAWGEVLTCGRKLSGEEFEFTKYHNVTEIFLNKRLVIKENLLLKPKEINVKAMGHLEGYTHQASLLCVSDDIKVNSLVNEIHELLSINNVCCGVSALPVNGLVVRMLGHKGEQLFDLQKKVVEFITKSTKVVADKAGLYAG